MPEIVIEQPGIISIDVRGRVEHAISSEPIPGWKSMNEVECYIDVDMGDYIVYNDWVGQVRHYSTLAQISSDSLTDRGGMEI